LQLDTKKELAMAVSTVMMKLMTVFQLIFFIFFFSGFLGVDNPGEGNTQAPVHDDATVWTCRG